VLRQGWGGFAKFTYRKLCDIGAKIYLDIMYKKLYNKKRLTK